MSQKQKQAERRLPELFVGPLGKAQLNAIKFAAGLGTVDSKLAIIEKMNNLNAILENKLSSSSEKAIAEALLEELTMCFLALCEDFTDERSFH
jgi:hypothetical protein